MTRPLATLLSALQSAGWTIELKDFPSLELFAEFTRNYPVLPPLLYDFWNQVKSCENSTNTAWILCEDDYTGRNTMGAYDWNAVEQMSFHAARGNSDWQSEVKQFWTQHLPIALSVETGYSYLGIETSAAEHQSIVYGREPDFEDATKACDSFEQLLCVLAGIESGPMEVEEDFRAMRRSGESGGFHPHSLALGGPTGQKITHTGETRQVRNQDHARATDLQMRMLRVIKRKMAE